MEAYPVTEFEAVVQSDGSIMLPKELKANITPGATVVVRLVEGNIAASLRARGIQEDEIEAIARLQMEQRADVIRFLATEGSFSRNRSFARRAASLIG
ncbi:MAG: hypothetical protein EPO24_08780 [Bacteroidetes bacterium]|nr:MAG: hypothetical protein EPO24_08780 [Bacteroidota bacterium]